MKQNFPNSYWLQNTQKMPYCSLSTQISPLFFTSKNISILVRSEKKQDFTKKLCVFSHSFRKNEHSGEDSIFFNFSFDKGRLKSIVSWFLEKYGQYKTLQLLEKLKEFGFGYATLGGISLGIDDLKVPEKKVRLLHEAETKVSKDLFDYRNAKISGIERMQRLIYTWNQTNDTLKQEVVKYFETRDLFNPIYMMAFSGARGNMSQVRQLVGMRGLMSDPQGQIIDFPIQSNFREGLTLTEYLISTYGARKGIVDTALRTATAGYLTRRLVDVAQHVIVSQFDCGTTRGIFLFDMKEANKTIYSFQNRLIGRVLARDINQNGSFENFNGERNKNNQILFFRNMEIDSKSARALSKITKKAFVRSPLTCETQKFICQLCYGWSLSSGKLVSVGEAIGVIAAQSIGEPGTQLTMRTFHTGGVFAGGVTDQILAPFDGQIEFFQSIPGTCIRTSLSRIAFLTKAPGSFFVKKRKEEKFPMTFNISETDEQFSNIQMQWKLQNKNTNFSEIYKIPSYAILFVRNGEFVEKKQLLAQFSTVLQKQVQYGSAEQTFYSTLAGEFILGGSNKFLSQSTSKSLNSANFFYLKKKEEEKYSSFGLFSDTNARSQRFEYDTDTTKRSQSLSPTPSIGDQQSVRDQGTKNKTKIFRSFSFDQQLENQNQIPGFSEQLENNTSSQNNQEKIELIVERKSNSGELSEIEQKYDLLWKSKNWTNIWILSGHMFSTSVQKQTYLKQGDVIKTTSVLNRILWKKRKNYLLFSSVCPVPFVYNKYRIETKKSTNMLYLKATEKQWRSRFFSSVPYSFDSLPFLQVGQIQKAFCFFLGEKLKKNQNREINTRSFFQNISTRNIKVVQMNENSNLFQNQNPQFFKKFFFSRITHTFFRKEDFFHFFKKQNSQIFSMNLQKLFSLLQKSKKTKRKNQNKQLFFQFSTMNKNSLYLDIYTYSKFRKKPKQTIEKKQISQEILKNYFSYSLPYFFSLKQKTKNTHSQLGVQTKTKKNHFSFDKLKKIPVYPFLSKNSQFLSPKHSKFMNFQQKYLGETNESLSNRKKGLENNLVFSKKKNGILKTKNNNKTFELLKRNTKTLFFKKSVFQFQFEKLRYNSVGYTSTFFFDSQKNMCFPNQNSFQLFVSLNQFSSKFGQTTNPGKNEILLGNSHYFGKDFPTFFGYCFPQNFQTKTNGIFLKHSFNPGCQKKRHTLFLCSDNNSFQTFSFNYFENKKTQKQKSFHISPNGAHNYSDFTKTKDQYVLFNWKSIIPSIIFPADLFYKKQINMKKKKVNVQKKVYYFKIKTFDFFQSFKNEKNLFQHTMLSNNLLESMSNHNGTKNKQNLSIDLFVNFHKQKFQIFKNNNFTSFSYLYKFQNHLSEVNKTKIKSIDSNMSTHNLYQNKFVENKNKEFSRENFSRNFFLFLKKRFRFQNQPYFQNNDLYTEEIFWLPQENYYISTLFFENQKQKQKNFQLRATKTNTFQLGQQESYNSCSRICEKNSPLFYLTNKQGKKKPIFSKLRGLVKWSPFSLEKLSYSVAQKRKNRQKFDFVQQKFSFFSEKSFENSFNSFRSENWSFDRKNAFSSDSPHTKDFYDFQSIGNQIENKIGKPNSKNVGSKYKIKNQVFGSFKTNKEKKNKGFLLLLNLRKKHKNASLHFFKLSKAKKGDQLGLFVNQNQQNFKNKQNQKKPVPNNLKRNFSYGFLKTKQKQTLWNLQKLFFNEFENNTLYSKTQKSHFQLGFAKKFFNNCFSCIPFEKKGSNKSNFHKKNAKIAHEKAYKPVQSFVPFLKSHKINMKVRSGWMYYCSNSQSVLNYHQQFFNSGQFLNPPVSFEQNKLFIETVVLNTSSSNVYDKKIQKSFSINQVVKNTKCRFSKEASFALEKFCFYFANGKQKNIHVSDEKNFEKQKKLVLFFRPFHYKVLENPNNYKKIFEDHNRQKKQRNKNFFNDFSKSNMNHKIFGKQLDFQISLSSIELYKKYHSFLWNSQKVSLMFLQKKIHFDFEIGTEFPKQMQKENQKELSFFKKLKRNQNIYETRAQKKEKNQKVFKLKSFSQKIRFEKFDSLVKRNFYSKRKKINSLLFQKNTNEKKSKSINKKKMKKQRNSSQFFFSFYPVQFLPMKLSSKILCTNFNNFSPFSNISNSQKILTLFVNSLTNKMQFCFCDKKAAFFNQRIFLSNSIYERSSNDSYWLNKDGLHFDSFRNSFVFQHRSKSERKTSFLQRKNLQKTNFVFSVSPQDPVFLQMKNKSKIYDIGNQNIQIGVSSQSFNVSNKRNKSNFVMKRKKIQKSKQVFVENTSFFNNPNYYGNTKFFSPYEGEILSIGTNEKNWWKKASEISTIQKLDNLLTIVTKTDFFAVQFPTTNQEFEKMSFSELKELNPIDIEKKKNYLVLNEQKQLKFCLEKKQSHLLSLYEYVFKTEKNSIFSTNFGLDQSEIEKNEFLKNLNGQERSLFFTKYENKLYKFRNLYVNYATCSKKPTLGAFFVYGDCIFQNAIRKPGQVVHVSKTRMTLRKGQPFLVSPKGILHFSNIPYIQKNVPLVTLPYQTVQSGDIVQGIPKVEQYFEARTTVQGRLFVSSLPIVLKGIFERYKATFPLEQATRQSFLKIQQIVVDGVQRVYRSQGVSITDKHLEVVVRQMTTKVQILHGAQTGFFPGELVNLDFVEKVNQFLMVKIRYEPVILGITRASLEVDSFLSASSFQQTTKILALASISKKKDFLKGLKENLLVGNLIPSGTGYFRLSKTVEKF